MDATLFDQKAAEWRSEQRSLLRAIEEHQGANESYLDDCVKLLEFAKRATILLGAVLTFSAAAQSLLPIPTPQKALQCERHEGVFKMTLAHGTDRLESARLVLRRIAPVETTNAWPSETLTR